MVIQHPSSVIHFSSYSVGYCYYCYYYYCFFCYYCYYCYHCYF